MEIDRPDTARLILALVFGNEFEALDPERQALAIRDFRNEAAGGMTGAEYKVHVGGSGCLASWCDAVDLDIRKAGGILYRML